MPHSEGTPTKAGWYKVDGEQRYWDGTSWGKSWAHPQRPGWHEKDGTLRYFDGAQWTEHIAPPPAWVLTTSGIASAVFLGVFAAFFLVWIGAQISPEHIYLPVKFVVKELPKGF